jgi:hypothetical protein
MNKRHFTLLELMAAMVVLLIMIGFLFHFIISSQNLWSASERNARIYENAQVFFDLLERDLTGAMVSTVPGQEIGIWIDPTSTTTPFLSLATAMQPLNVGEPNVYEVHYYLSATTGGTYEIMRSVVAQSDGADWDFYGDNTNGWVASQGPNPQDIIDGVEVIELVCLDAAGNELPPGPAYTGTVYYSLPASARVTVTLVDQKANELGLGGTALSDRLDASRRKFTKVFFLSH